MGNMKKIVLASTSPRRKEILKNLGLKFETISPKYDENIENKIFSYEKIEEIAKNKCASVINYVDNNSIVISADTVVIYKNEVMGKPKDYQEAFKMLSKLNGETHKVVTAVCVTDCANKNQIIKSETSEVTFNRINEEKIDAYISQYKPYDKAGSYGIQELPQEFIKEIKGEFDNIVGLPSKILIKMLQEISFIV